MKQTFLVQQLFDGQSYIDNAAIMTENGIITQIVANVTEASTLSLAHDCQLITLKGMIVPGFIDIQVNGGGGALFNAQPSLACIKTIAKAHAAFGTTAFLPTVITDDITVMQQAADAVALAMSEKTPGVLGIHFEGPHLSVPKKGVHPAHYVREVSAAELALFTRQDLGHKVVTLAPENVAPEVITQLVKAGVKVCLGHSNADYQTVVNAINAGAVGFTHLFNAMSALNSREPGMVGAALEDDNTWCGLIVDGHHVHYAAAKVALRSKPQGKIMLVTDAMPPVGQSNDASFELFGTQVIRQGDRLNTPTGELAGCVLDMNGAVNNSVKLLGVSRDEALRMASQYPADFLGISQTHGAIKVGQTANMVLLNEHSQVVSTYIHGQVLV
ncbi:N-acetylglucosamine-6-phosphate deacetylase [Shewanella intestini]|uniref:N-acetylgalactosamine-6-phosphate deacetylase n=1 Tax=Shewanella intestini TaxID=2017544 RepID=A0ABS5I079_9GAMM|nr:MULTISPECIES: N-acetylglucosamine-6-phosphate deacetylase [Shewanella]MBR9726710.1 N-acetylglucosamine-6-phosphate deacetylase [Shewanella intestini]MRG34724.1 N-acetylglucosamine-6-phosphate deacetylase [Shewanella sp. XMDDZSB0408]